MPGLRDIKRRRDSVRNTRKILYAMKLISAAKLRKTQEAVQRSGEYTAALNSLLRDLTAEIDTTQISHPLMQTRSEIKTITVLVVGANRGLCGGYNAILGRSIESFVAEQGRKHPGAKLDLRILGKKPAEYCRRKRREYSSAVEDLSDDVSRWPLEETCQSLEADFLAGRTDEVWMIYTKFKSAISMKPVAERLFPMEQNTESPTSQEQTGSRGTILFEPSARAVFESLVPRLIRTKIRQGSLDAKTSEHGSRMVAMDNATKNADEVAQKLTIYYNKERQRAITAELLDIVGGAEAIS